MFFFLGNTSSSASQDLSICSCRGSEANVGGGDSIVYKYQSHCESNSIHQICFTAQRVPIIKVYHPHSIIGPLQYTVISAATKRHTVPRTHVTRRKSYKNIGGCNKNKQNVIILLYDHYYIATENGLQSQSRLH